MLLQSTKPRSVYVHVPFCVQRCGYCDFSILAGRDDLIPRYLQALDLEISRCLENSDQIPELDTLFIGGGRVRLYRSPRGRFVEKILQSQSLARCYRFHSPLMPAKALVDF